MDRRTPLGARLPAGSDALAEHDATIDTVDHASIAGRHGALRAPSPETERKYRSWLKRYQQWCVERRYQAELQFLTDAKAEEFIASLVVEREGQPRRTPNTVTQALAALRYGARRAATNPMPSFDGAYGVAHRYMDELASKGVIASRQARRIRPGDPVG